MIKQDLSVDPSSSRVGARTANKAASRSSIKTFVKTAAPVILIGPSGFYEEGIQQVLKANDFEILGRSPTLEALDPALAAQARIAIVMDPADQPNLPQAVAAFGEGEPALRFVLLIDTSSPQQIASALRVPAHAFLCQKIGCDPLVKAIDIVLDDGAVLSIEVMSYLMGRLTEALPPAAPATAPAAPAAPGSCRTFSDREVDVLRCLTDGASNKLIARRFQIAESTVKIHVKGILRKINVQNRTQAAIWALAQAPAFDRIPAKGSERVQAEDAPLALQAQP